MIYLLSFILLHYKIRSPLEQRLPCPKSSKYFVSLKKAYFKIKNSNATTNYENSILGNYSECVVEYHSKRNSLYIKDFEDVLLNCCTDNKNSECREIWAPNVLSCLIHRREDIDGSKDEAYRKREIDQNYQLTTKLNDSLYLIKMSKTKQQRKYELSKLSNDDEPETKWISCPKNSKYLSSLYNTLNLIIKIFPAKHFKLSKFNIFSKCFVEYIINRGPDINPEMEHALYKCCDKVESSKCEEDWAINILSCWIEHRYFFLEHFFVVAVSRIKKIKEGISKEEHLKSIFEEKPDAKRSVKRKSENAHEIVFRKIRLKVSDDKDAIFKDSE